jgi:hypothetical protein
MTLNEMLTQLRVEARISTNVAHGAHLNDNHVSLLRRTQEELYNAHDWPLLRMVQTQDIPAGTRYATYPDAMDFEGIREAYSLTTGSDWFEIGYGIEAEHMNIYDSDIDEQSNTVLRWQHYVSPEAESLNQNMFEVWPISNRDTKVRFAGKRKLYPLTNIETDRSTIDGPLIVLHAAAELLAGQRAEDAGLKLQKAQARLDLLRRRQSGPDNRRVNMASPSPRRMPRPGIDYIP